GGRRALVRGGAGRQSARTGTEGFHNRPIGLWLLLGVAARMMSRAPKTSTPGRPRPARRGVFFHLCIDEHGSVLAVVSLFIRPEILGIRKEPVLVSKNFRRYSGRVAGVFCACRNGKRSAA